MCERGMIQQRDGVSVFCQCSERPGIRWGGSKGTHRQFSSLGMGISISSMRRPFVPAVACRKTNHACPQLTLLFTHTGMPPDNGNGTCTLSEEDTPMLKDPIKLHTPVEYKPWLPIKDAIKLLLLIDFFSVAVIMSLLSSYFKDLNIRYVQAGRFFEQLLSAVVASTLRCPLEA